MLPETVANAMCDAADVGSGDSSPDVMQSMHCPLVNAPLPSPEPTVSLRAQPINPICILDMLQEVEPVGKQPAAGCMRAPQTRLKAAIEQSPELQLIDSIVVFICARLAACSICNEFSSRLPNYPPKRLSGMDKQCSKDVFNITNRTSNDYLPSAKAALLLPKTLPATLSQALILHPGFNGHKPALFVEGEGRLGTVVNKITSPGVIECSLNVLEALPKPSQDNRCSKRVKRVVHGPHDTSLPVPPHVEVIEWCSKCMSIVSMSNGALEGLYPVSDTVPIR